MQYGTDSMQADAEPTSSTNSSKKRSWEAAEEKRTAPWKKALDVHAHAVAESSRTSSGKRSWDETQSAATEQSSSTRDASSAHVQGPSMETEVETGQSSSTRAASSANVQRPSTDTEGRILRPPSLHEDLGDNRFDHRCRRRASVCESCYELGRGHDALRRLDGRHMYVSQAHAQ